MQGRGEGVAVGMVLSVKYVLNLPAATQSSSRKIQLFLSKDISTLFSTYVLSAEPFRAPPSLGDNYWFIDESITQAEPIPALLESFIETIKRKTPSL